jgi:predicted RNase H-related nuclease YkuK (DUF458 family)
MKSPTYGNLTIAETVNNISNFIKSHPGDYKFIIGTDSQMYGNSAIFVTAMIVHRVGKGAIYFYDKKWVRRKFGLADRMFAEAGYSIELASNLVNEINRQHCPFCDDISKLEIHIDVGQNGDTREVVSAVVGMVKGSGFNVKVKPDSYGASTVADKYTKHYR